MKTTNTAAAEALSCELGIMYLAAGAGTVDGESEPVELERADARLPRRGGEQAGSRLAEALLDQRSLARREELVLAEAVVGSLGPAEPLPHRLRRSREQGDLLVERHRERVAGDRRLPGGDDRLDGGEPCARPPDGRGGAGLRDRPPERGLRPLGKSGGREAPLTLDEDADRDALGLLVERRD